MLRRRRSLRGWRRRGGGARRTWGAASGEGPYLFGAFGAVDAMFAPVAFRLKTYCIALNDADAAAYVAALLANENMRLWEREALVEGDAIAHYDAQAIALGCERR